MKKVGMIDGISGEITIMMKKVCCLKDGTSRLEKREKKDGRLKIKIKRKLIMERMLPDGWRTKAGRGV